MIILLMGVTGAGKTTVGRALAAELKWGFADADDYHSAANIAKMRAGIALTDEDRAPWLESLRSAIQSWIATRENIVLACSALKSSYREMLVVSPDVQVVYLRASEALIAQRLAGRSGHYMNPALAPSQFATLEEPAGAITVDAAAGVPEILQNIRQQLGL